MPRSTHTTLADSEIQMEAKLKTVPMTADDVLKILQDSHRHQCAFDPEADPGVELKFETSVAKWRNAWDLVDADSLGVALNEFWEMAVPEEAWRSVLEPPQSRSLRDVCDLVAANARKFLLQPAGAFGAKCEAADAFLAVRALLVRAGAPGSAIRPSAPIEDLARQFPAIFFGPISHLAPGRLPTVVIRTPWHTLAVSVVGLGLLGVIAGSFINSRLAAWSFGLAALAYVGTWITVRLRPAEVRFGTIKTFRDLAELIASAPTA